MFHMPDLSKSVVNTSRKKLISFTLSNTAFDVYYWHLVENIGLGIRTPEASSLSAGSTGVIVLQLLSSPFLSLRVVLLWPWTSMTPRISYRIRTLTAVTLDLISLSTSGPASSSRQYLKCTARASVRSLSSFFPMALAHPPHQGKAPPATQWSKSELWFTNENSFPSIFFLTHWKTHHILSILPCYQISKLCTFLHP